MKSKWLHGVWIAVVSLMIAVPAYANTATTNGGNGGLGNGMKGMQNGTSANRDHSRMHMQSNGNLTRTKSTPNYDISVYGTPTGSQFQNVNANDNGMTDQNRDNRMQTNTNNGYRALNTNTTRGMDWGWLGLLGLIGLAGLFNRNPQRNR